MLVRLSVFGVLFQTFGPVYDKPSSLVLVLEDAHSNYENYLVFENYSKRISDNHLLIKRYSLYQHQRLHSDSLGVVY